MLRRMLLLGAALWTATALAAPPQRNLAVELRWVEEQQQADRGTAAAGDVVIGTGGRADARGAAVLHSQAHDAQATAVQRLTVLNGARAGVRLTQAVPLQWLELAATPRGPIAVLRQDWMEADASFDVRPLWPGGQTPVTVEIAHRSAGPGGSDAAFTTVQLPLGEWVTVAQGAQAGGTAERGVLSTRDVERRSRQLLQMRVSLP